MKIENPNEVSNVTAEPKKKSKFLIFILLIVVTSAAIYFGRGLITNMKYEDISFYENLDSIELLIENEDRYRFVYDQIDDQVEIIEKSIKLNSDKRLLGNLGKYSDLSFNDANELEELIQGFLLYGGQNPLSINRLGEIINSVIEKIGLDDFRIENDFTLATLNLSIIYDKEYFISLYATKKKGELIASEPLNELSELLDEKGWVDSEIGRNGREYYREIVDIIINGESDKTVGLKPSTDLRTFERGLGRIEIMEDNIDLYKETIGNFIKVAEKKSN